MYGSLHIKSANTFGLSRAQIQNVRAAADDDSFAMEVDVQFPKLITEGKYKGEGRFNAIKVVSKGYFNVTTSMLRFENFLSIWFIKFNNILANVTTTWKISGRSIQRNGETYVLIDKFDMSPEVGDMKIYATGLFPDPGLSK